MGRTRPIRLLVVCSGNTCRSPMAEALLTAELTTGGVAAVVTSAGTEGPAGRPASTQTIEVMAEVGIDMTGHQSRLIDGADVDGADPPYGGSTDRYRLTRGRLAVASVTIAEAIATSACP